MFLVTKFSRQSLLHAKAKDRVMLGHIKEYVGLMEFHLSDGHFKSFQFFKSRIVAALKDKAQNKSSCFVLPAQGTNFILFILGYFSCDATFQLHLTCH